MSRTITEIESSLEASITDVFNAPSASLYAEWKLLVTIFARAVWTFEQILDLFKVGIEALVQEKQPGTIAWYFDQILAFQGEDDGSGNFQGDTLVVDNGAISYAIVDVSRQLVKQGSLSDNAGTLVIKVAKESAPGVYAPLTASEIIAFNVYLANIKYPGTVTTVTTLEADRIKFTLEIVYDPIFTTATVQENIDAKLAAFNANLGFEDKVYKNQILNAIGDAEGVVAVKDTLFQGWNSTGQTYTAIDIVWTLESGYFNYDAGNIFTFTNYKTL